MLLYSLISLVVGAVDFCPQRVARLRSMLSCPRRTPARLRSPWPPAHGQPAGKRVTPSPSSRALSRPPCRGASRAPSRWPCWAEGSTLRAGESADSTEGQAPRGGRQGLPYPASPAVRRDRCSQPRYVFSSPRYVISSLAAAAPARFAPMVDAEGPYPTRLTLESFATCVANLPVMVMPPLASRSMSGAR